MKQVAHTHRAHKIRAEIWTEVYVTARSLPLQGTQHDFRGRQGETGSDYCAADPRPEERWGLLNYLGTPTKGLKSISLYIYFILLIYLTVLRHMGSFNHGMWELVSWPGIKPGPPALGAWCLSHWTTRKSLESLVSFPSRPALGGATALCSQHLAGLLLPKFSSVAQTYPTLLLPKVRLK